MSPRLVAVFGATGTQGSSVVKALLEDGIFTPRAVTRNTNSKKALELKELGVEVIEADLWDISSIERAMHGVEGVFGITNYYDPKVIAMGPTSEELLGKNLVDAAVKAGVKLFIWSSLPHCTRATNGKYTSVWMCDNKANVDDYLRDSQLPHSILYTGWFSENTWNYNCLTGTPDSPGYELTVPRVAPDSYEYMTWVERDLGQCVLALLKHYKDESAHILGETFYAVSEKLTYTDYASAIGKALGKPVRYVTGEDAGMEELNRMYDYHSEFGLYPFATIPDPRLERLGVKFHSMEAFAEDELKKKYA